jgi:hypothetical protein
MEIKMNIKIKKNIYLNFHNEIIFFFFFLLFLIILIIYDNFIPNFFFFILLFINPIFFKIHLFLFLFLFIFLLTLNYIFNHIKFIDLHDNIYHFRLFS